LPAFTYKCLFRPKPDNFFPEIFNAKTQKREDFGLRWQSAAATPLFDCGPSFQSGVALRFPPQSKKIWL
jgi:hypothetical protein